MINLCKGATGNYITGKDIEGIVFALSVSASNASELWLGIANKGELHGIFLTQQDARALGQAFNHFFETGELPDKLEE